MLGITHVCLVSITLRHGLSLTTISRRLSTESKETNSKRSTDTEQAGAVHGGRKRRVAYSRRPYLFAFRSTKGFIKARFSPLPAIDP
jgi:hypothetical protein